MEPALRLERVLKSLIYKRCVITRVVLRDEERVITISSLPWYLIHVCSEVRVHCIERVFRH